MFPKQKSISYKLCFKMYTLLCYLVLVFCSVLVSSTDLNGPCTTPNGEKARCVSIYSCKIIEEAILTLNASALEFARNSQCGYLDTPLVCCGTSAYPVSSEEPPESHLLPDATKCGFDIEQDRVYGGQTTELNEFPWMALLGYQLKDGNFAGFKCGGSLINERYILTAAHCILTSKTAEIALSFVRLGEWRISTERDCIENLVNQECIDPVIDLKIEQTIVHPEYSRRTGNNDIALIRLEKNVNFTESVSPICLPSYYAPFRDVGTIMTIAGWGSTENSSQSDVKIKAKIPIVATSTCKASLRNRGQVTDNHVCAGGVKGKDACQGDSGGPLMGTYTRKGLYDLQWYLEGIVSWGIGCAGREVPGIYTRVAKYMMWILENMTEF